MSTAHSSNASPFVKLDGVTWTLTVAPRDTETLVSGKIGDGQGDLIKGLQRTPLAAAVLTAAKPRRMDHVHLSRFSDTDYCRWYGRAADGFHHPLGPILQMVRVNA